jgi:hypothetical protein
MTDSSNFTSGYEGSYSQSEVNIRSPELTRKSVIHANQADSCFESDTNNHPDESPKLERQLDALPIVHFFEKPTLKEEKGLKRRQHPELTSAKHMPLKKRNLSFDYGQPA